MRTRAKFILALVAVTTTGQLGYNSTKNYKAYETRAHTFQDALIFQTEDAAQKEVPDKVTLEESRTIDIEETTPEVVATVPEETPAPVVEEPKTEVKEAPKKEAVKPAAPAPAAKAPEAPKYSQYVSLNGTYYPFKVLALETAVAQSFIDKNPGSYGMWKNVTYATTFDILFAHYYAAGKLVYDSSVGDTVTLRYEDGTTVSYRVVSKVVASVNDYYNASSPLWSKVGHDFDLMIKTCYEVNKTDLIITLVRI